jgi:hypothetical protein
VLIEALAVGVLASSIGLGLAAHVSASGDRSRLRLSTEQSLHLDDARLRAVANAVASQLGQHHQQRRAVS